MKRNVFHPHRDPAPAFVTLILIPVIIVAYFTVPPICLTADTGWLHDGWFTRATYHFFHANALHLSLNVYCLLALAFFYPLTMNKLILAFLVASTYPVGLFPPSAPIIGMSGVIYVLLGLHYWNASSRTLLLISVLCYALAGMFMGNIAVGLHLYCFFAGFLLSLITADLYQ